MGHNFDITNVSSLSVICFDFPRWAIVPTPPPLKSRQQVSNSVQPCWCAKVQYFVLSLDEWMYERLIRESFKNSVRGGGTKLIKYFILLHSKGIISYSKILN